MARSRGGAGSARPGHDVTCLARGESGRPADGVTWVSADRTRPDAYDGCATSDWDAVVDVSWQPGMVRSALAGSVTAPGTGRTCRPARCTPHAEPDADEPAELLPALEGDGASREQYGEAKVACEAACADAVGGRLLVARSGLIGGYGDPSDRFGYWPGRFARAASGAVPGSCRTYSTDGPRPATSGILPSGWCGPARREPPGRSTRPVPGTRSVRYWTRAASRPGTTGRSSSCRRPG